MPPTAATGSWEWKHPALPVSVCLPLELVDRLNAVILRGFGAVPKRGAEVGGILVGRKRPSDGAFLLDDFIEVPCEYAYGPSYLLSTADLQRFQEVFEQAATSPSSRPLGFFRSHTRDGFQLQDPDRQLFARCFPNQDGVFLLVKPSPFRTSTAAFLLYSAEGLEMQPSGEFPFRSKELAKSFSNQDSAVEPAAAVAPAVAQAVAQAVPSTEQPPPPPLASAAGASPVAPGTTAAKSSFWGYVLAWLIYTAAVLVCGGVAGYRYAQFEVLEKKTASPAPPGPLGLSVSRSGEALQVRWDPASPLLDLARSARLLIREGAASQTIDLNLNHLRQGVVLYRHIAPEVQFRFELTTSDGRELSESVIWQSASKF